MGEFGEEQLAFGPGGVEVGSATLTMAAATVLASRPVAAALGPVEVVAEDELRLPRGKRLLDIAVATTILLFTLPLFALVALLVRLDGGPVLFVQRRLGTGGRHIRVAKFRTMSVDAEARLQTDTALHASYVANGFKLPAGQDPRLTRIGHFLRVSSIDELPQLLCVLRGDMTMVGPRPIVVSELTEYTSRQAGPAYLSARPGLTGLWQVSGRSQVGYDERVALDLAYLEQISVWGDLRILARTVPAILRRRGAC